MSEHDNRPDHGIRRAARRTWIAERDGRIAPLQVGASCARPKTDTARLLEVAISRLIEAMFFSCISTDS
jgi:hypothetical protein